MADMSNVRKGTAFAICAMGKANRDKQYSSDLEAQVNQLKARVTNLEVANITINSRITAVEGRVTNVEGRVTVLEGRTGQATETQVGVARIATAAEASAGTDNTTIITPLKLKNTITQYQRRGINTSATPVALTANANNTIPSNGFVRMTQTAALINQAMNLQINGLMVDARTIPLIGGVAVLSFPVSAGQIARPNFNTAASTYSAAFYPD